MNDFVPPFPERPKEPLPPLALLRAARRNLLAIWHEKSFEYQFFSTRVLARPLFVCNSPDTVAAAFINHHDSFERKTPQMRHALAPLLGDGLFISDGETWRRRRRIVAPIVHASRLPLFAPVMIEAAAEVAERWERLPPGTPIDVLREMATLTAEIICRTVFGRRLGAEHAHLVASSFSTYQRLVGQLDLISLLGLPDWLPRLRAPAIRREAARIHRVLDDIIASCRGRRGSKSGCTASSTPCSAAGCRPSRMSRCSSIPARFSRRRSGFTRRSRCSAARPCAARGSATDRCRGGRWSSSCPGCCTGTANSGTAPTVSCPSAFCRDRPGCARAISTFRSAPARGSAPAPRSARPKRSCVLPRWRSGCGWRLLPAPSSRRSAG